VNWIATAYVGAVTLLWKNVLLWVNKKLRAAGKVS